MGEAAWPAEGFVHAAGFGGAAAIWAGRVGVGGGDEAELMEYVGGAVFVGTDIKGFFRAEDLIGQRLEGFEKFVDAGVECAGLAGGKHFSGRAVGEPEVDGGADERGGAGGGPDEQGEPAFDGGGEAEVVATVGDEIELEVTGHGRPVEEVRFVEGTDLASDEFRVAGELPQEPWSEWGGPRDKGWFEGVDEGGAGHVFGDGMVAVAAGLGLEFIEALRRHEHDFRGVVGLSEIEQWEVAAGVEG